MSIRIISERFLNRPAAVRQMKETYYREFNMCSNVYHRYRVLHFNNVKSKWKWSDNAASTVSSYLCLLNCLLASAFSEVLMK